MSDSDLTPIAEPVPHSPWAGRSVTGPDGACATVRRVYRVGGLDVAVLTCRASGCRGVGIWAEPVDLLATGEQPATFPDFAALVEEMTGLEMAVLYGKADEAQLARYKELRDLHAPYARAGVDLHQALTDRVSAGDRVVHAGMFGTVVDPDARPNGMVRTFMLVRLDKRHLRKDRALRRAHPDRTVLLSALTLWPTLGLLGPAAAARPARKPRRGGTR